MDLDEFLKEYVAEYAFETKLYTFVNVLSGVGDLTRQKLDGVYKAIAVNIGMSNSKIFDSVWRKECNRSGEGPAIGCPDCQGTGYTEPYDLKITFCRRFDRKWNVSLYSTNPDIDCGSVAKSFGGGGHKGAAGFQCDELPFEY